MRRFSFRPGLELRGRKFHGLRGFAGKPLHPPLTDVTVGAYFIGPLLSIVAFVFRGEEWSSDLFRAGGWVLVVGAVSSALTLLTGFADWLDTERGTQIRRMANAHAVTMLLLTGVVLVSLATRYLGDTGEEPSVRTAVLDLITLGLVTLGGTLGGSLTYDWGFNVQTATDSPVYHPSEEDVIHPH